MGDISIPSDNRKYNVPQWIEENKKFFLPPICNKMMHKEGQMKHFFVGGPNQRKDYHIECGEELFLQIKGDMVLKIVEKNVHKDIHIKQGQLFLLPARIQHSPQRFENTVGMVVERDRHPAELDGLRYFVEEDGKPTLESLFEKWFYCEDLGSQLAPIIEGFFASEQLKTGKPIPGSIPDEKPFELDMETEVEPPFSLQEWIDAHRSEINQHGQLPIFDTDKYQFKVFIYGKGDHKDKVKNAETWVWQWEGHSKLSLDDEKHDLQKDDSFLISTGASFSLEQEEGSTALVCYQDPTKAPTWPKQ